MPSPGYETLSNQGVSNQTLEDQAQGENLDAIVAALPLAGSRKVLDVGCGTGALTRRIALSLGTAGLVYGVDVSPHHIEHARRMARNEGLSNLRFVEADFLSEDCGLPRDFDLVVEKYLLMYEVPQGRDKVFLARMRDCTRPGGKVALIEADVNFGGERHPPPPEPLASVLPRIVEYYRRKGLIEWRCGLQLFHHLRQAGLRDVKVTLAEGRIIAGGSPPALVQHASRDVDELIRPCLEEMGLVGESSHVATQWREYLSDPASFLYTPIFVGEATVRS
jgi:SAM-dependent methyltransferase